MPINQLVDYCLDNYAKNGKCQECELVCTGICNSCLEEIHNDRLNLREYNCVNMVNCYVCSYNYKYASEIFYLLNSLISHPSTKKDKYNILSIGCGGCADIFGIDHFITSNNKIVSVSYTGIDLNNRWMDIHQQITQIFKNYVTDFIYQDVFDYFDSLNEVNFNIVIIQYLLNEIIKRNNQERIDNFINNLVEKVIDRLPSGSLIIFNDINHNFVRDYYPIIKRKALINNSILDANLRFRNPISHTYGGTTFTNDNLIFQTHNDVRFQIKKPCSSCIYVMYKK